MSVIHFLVHMDAVIGKTLCKYLFIARDHVDLVIAKIVMQKKNLFWDFYSFYLKFFFFFQEKKSETCYMGFHNKHRTNIQSKTLKNLITFIITY
jgi:hypothetical protein